MQLHLDMYCAQSSEVFKQSFPVFASVLTYLDNPPCMCLHSCRQFTDAALGLSLTILNSLIDLVSFSGILYSIYPPLFAALLAYSVGGTLGSIALGKVNCTGTICQSGLAVATTDVYNVSLAAKNNPH